MKVLTRWLAGRASLLTLFFLSGCSGLIYETIWSRYVRQILGSAAVAQVLVLALFMGGMSVGALLASRVTPKIRSPILVYGVIEGLLGIFALSFPWLFDATLRFAYDTLLPRLGEGSSVLTVRWVLCGVLILPPCVLLGMTFPLMSVGILRTEPERSGEILSGLYFSNSLGAALGALLCGFVLVGTWGLPGALRVAATLNLLIFAVCVGARPSTRPALAHEVPGNAGAPQDRGGLLLWVAFGTGFSSFIYEVGWIRLLSMIIGSATHSFEIMLSAFILGLALGGRWIKGRLDQFREPVLVLAVVQVVMGFCAVATLPFYGSVAELLAFIIDAEHPTLVRWYAFNGGRYLCSLLIMLPATFCAGMTLPLLTHVWLRAGGGERVVGRIYGANTLGAICGAASGGLVLLPWIGLKWALFFGAGVDLLLGVVLAVAARQRMGSRLAWIGVLGVGLLVSFGLVFSLDPAVLTASTFRLGRARQPTQNEILSFVDGRTATVAVVETNRRFQERVIYTNGKPDASVVVLRHAPHPSSRATGPRLSGDEPNQFLLGALPLAIHPHARNVAMIGFGSGMSIHTLLASPALSRLDTVEIEPEMVAGSRYFYPENARAYDDPRSHIHYDDAKAFFAYRRAHYDIIISEPTNPWVSGVASLFTLEFYAEINRHLAQGGVFAQWIQGYELSDELVVSVLSAVDRAFADYVIYQIGPADWLILCFPSSQAPPLSADVFQWPLMVRQLATLGIDRLAQLDALFAANRQLLHPFLQDQEPNTDRFPLLDTRAEESRFFRRRSDLLFGFSRNPVPFLEFVRPSSLDRYPERALSDLRDPHLFARREQADWILRAFLEPPTQLPRGVNVSVMRDFLAVDAQLDAAHGALTTEQCRRWLTTVWRAFEAIAPYRHVHQSAWWQAVLSRTVQQGLQGEVLAEQVSLLDALDRRNFSEVAHRWPLWQRGEWTLPAEFLEQVEAYLILDPTVDRAPSDPFHDPSWLVDSASPHMRTWAQVLRAYVASASAR